VHDLVEVFEVYFALASHVEQLKRLLQLFFFASVHHDIDVREILVETDEAISVLVHDFEHSIGQKRQALHTDQP
jgi:hypothetical protein